MQVLGCLLIGLLSSWLLGTCYDNLQYKAKFCYIGRTYLHWPPPMVFQELHDVLISPLAGFIEIWHMLSSFVWGLQCKHLFLSNICLCMLVDCPPDSHMIIMQLTHDLLLWSLGLTIHLPFSIIPSITTMYECPIQPSFLQYLIFAVLPTSDDVSLRCCRWSSLTVACCISCIVMQFTMFFAVPITLMFDFLPSISSSRFSLWFCLESQSAMNRSDPGL